MLTIVRTIDNTGYWITVGGRSTFNTNLRLGLEQSSDDLEEVIGRLQEQIAELRTLQAEVNSELEKQGGQLRPRRVSIPKTELWFSTCANCELSDHNLNMVAVEVTIGGVKIFCSKCAGKKFPSLF